MLHLIIKNLWARRSRNGWLLAELILVAVIMWNLTDKLVVTLYDNNLPIGFQEEGLYYITLASVPPQSARFDADNDTKEAKMSAVRQMVSRIRSYEGVQYATLQFQGVGPFQPSSYNDGIKKDSTSQRVSVMQFFFEPQSDFFRTFGFDEVEGQTNEQLDAKTFGHKEITTTTDLFSGETQSLGYQYNDYWADTLHWTATATIGKLRMYSGRQPQAALILPTKLDENNIPDDVQIVFRIHPEINAAQFENSFLQWAQSNLRVGNLYMRTFMSYPDLIHLNGEQTNVNYNYRINSIMAIFFLISLFLGVTGTFWMQTRSRKEEVGVMKSFGARNAHIVGMLMGEGAVLTTVATFIGSFIYLQYGISEGFYSNLASYVPISTDYWVNNFWQHFFGISGIVWGILLVVVSLGVYIPAKSLSSVSPVDALRDE